MRTGLIMLAVTLAASANLPAQIKSSDPTPLVPRYTLSAGYQLIESNAPPANCNCFGLNGGYGSAAWTYKYWLRAAGEVTGSHGSKIGPLGQDLTLITYTAGPQVVLHQRHTEDYVQFLIGGAHGGDSYFPRSTGSTTSANSFAFSAGGGLDVAITHRVAIRAIEIQYLHTGFPNGTDNSQNHLMLGFGVVARLQDRFWTPHTHR